MLYISLHIFYHLFQGAKDEQTSLNLNEFNKYAIYHTHMNYGLT